MERLAKNQAEIGQTIQQIISNYKKDSADRKNLAYYQERLRRLEEQWIEFDANDTKIRDLHRTTVDHEYFQKDYYQEIMKLYKEYRTHFEMQIQSLMPSKSQGDNATDYLQQKNEASEAAEKPAPDSVRDEISRTCRRQAGIIESLRRVILSIAPEPQSKNYYEFKVKTINQYWSQIEELNFTIWELSEEPAVLGYNVKNYIQLEEEIQNILTELSLKVNDSPKVSNAESTMVRLPKIVLPKFDGDYLKWKQFSDLFTEMVHKQSMSNCQKMWYLKTNLLGEAERLLRHFSLTEENYLTAWKTLQDRYNNQRLLVASLVNKLLSQPSHASDNVSSGAIKGLHDTTQECLMGLQNLGISTENWDPLILHILLKKLDKTTHTLYEQSLTQPRQLQKISEFLSFLETRFQSLEALGSKVKPTTDQKGYTSPRTTSLLSTVSKCVSCKGNHPLYACKDFIKLSPEDRLKLVQRHRLCVNCFKDGHNAAKCTLRSCTKCTKKHNSLVHLNIESSKSPKVAVTDSKQVSESSKLPMKNDENSLSMTALQRNPPKGYVILSTAKVKLILDNGQDIECRAILDSGSQVNIMTEGLVRKLGLRPAYKSMTIQGIGRGKQGTQGRVNVTLESRTNDFSAKIEACVLPHIVSMQPSQVLDVSNWGIPKNLSLADPNFFIPGPIDLLIGAEFYYQLLSIGQIKLGTDLPTLQNTVFGWIVSGKVAGIPEPSAVCNVATNEESLEQAMEKFWEIEESEDTKSKFTPREKRCESHFNQTVQRKEDGRFIVRLPFIDEPTRLGVSKDIALRRFFSLEHKLAKNDELRKQYTAFMDEYIKLGHMEEIDTRFIQPPSYYLPHHCVIKPSSSTTKLRVVFDASAKSSSNTALNDILHTGPTIQDDLFSILLRFRMPRFVFTADIEKMYRQILLSEEDQKYQLIYWRRNPHETLKNYRLRTVTYGTTTAPYLAIKCLQRLAEEGAHKYPLGSAALSKDFYVDDCMTGSDSLVTAKMCQEQVTALLTTAGFKLRKWCANHPQLLQNIPAEDQEIQLDFTKQEEEHVKTLGLIWLPKTDEFRIKVTQAEETKINKRGVASDIARIFDPLGMMGPVVITAKIFLQELWQLKLHWDAALPAEMHTRWTNFRAKLNTLNNVQFPRHTYAREIPKSIQLHAFADASEKAYGAAIYIRAINKDDRIIVRLLCAKSRVAPLKKLTIPRLELCAAKLAAELTNRVKTTLKLENVTTLLWSDSEVVLNWINSPSTAFQTFVANRVASIHEITMTQQWRHVSSQQNPADVLSRGISPEKLTSCLIWFYGPQFLHGPESIWPPPFKTTKSCELERRKITLVTQEKVSEVSFLDGINHGNSFRKLQRIFGYIIRFIQSTKGKNRALSTTLTVAEREESLQIIVRLMQASEFKDELHQLRKHRELNKNNSLLGLAPFVDDVGILRVGGRLKESHLSYDAKHQILLPYSHQLTKLLMKDLHQENLHVGPQGLLSITRQRFWPIKGKTLARSIVQHCIRCAKAKPKMFSQLMGNLPGHRIQPARPFINAGVDFCGPIWTHFRLRGKRPQKSYVAVFCCFATKAVHLEVVSDLSTDAFIGALRRFIGRRGHCSHIYCDNATNFVGARNRLEKLSETIYSDEAKAKIQSECGKKSIEFHFIPPRAPHFGGLWEAAVKSAKHLLQRSVEPASLTYEELETLIVEIESILNSRPLTAMSDNPNDLTALTPGHFLVGEPLTATIDPNAESVKGGLLSRWKLVSHVKNEFWRRWSLEYLHELQHRSTWKKACQNVELNTIVIVQEDNLPVMKWPLGRIIKTYKGDDGLVRVVDVKTSSGIFRRPISRLAPLPCEINGESSNQIQPSNKDADKRCTKRAQESKEVEINETSTSSATATKCTDTSNPSRKIKRRNSFASSIVTVLLTCLIIPFSRGSPINITKFGAQPGIHFDNLGISKLISNEWNIIVYYNLQPYWSEFESLRNGTKVLEHLCNQIRQKSSCMPLLDQFRHLVLELNQDNELLTSKHTGSRSRRGAINLVGNIANSLFGVLDSQYAEDMSKNIAQIKTNEDYMMKMLKNQTSIIDSTINIMKKDQELIKQKFEQLDNQFTQIIKRTNNNTEELYQHKIQHLLSSWAIHMTLISTTLHRTQAAIIDVITDSHHGKISHLLLSPQQLQRELQKIRAHLPQSSHLPADDVLQIYRLLSTEGRILNHHAIFRLKLPLVHQDKFELFRLFPIPAIINNTRVIIKPTTNLLAISLHRDEYYPMSESELSSCKTIEEGVFLCNQFHPVFARRTKTNACEFNMFNNMPTTKQCTLKTTKDNIWRHLSHINQWMYALTEKITLNAVCNDTAFPLTLEGAGTITIQPECTISHEILTIRGHQKYHSKMRTSYTKQKELSILVSSEELESLANNTLQYKTQQPKIDELLKQLSAQNLELPNVIDQHDIHHFSVGYVSLFLGITIILYLAWKVQASRQKHTVNQKPVPLPRRTQSVDFSVNV